MKAIARAAFVLAIITIVYHGSLYAQTVDDFDLALRWAPIFYCDIHPDNLSAEIPTSIDFDGTAAITDNWDNLATVNPEASVYFAVVESESHFFISYYLYHPRDWESIDKTDARTSTEADRLDYDMEHEHDLEGVTLVVAKPGDSIDDLLVAYTQAHGDTYYFTPGTPAIPNCVEDNEGNFIPWDPWVVYSRDHCDGGAGSGIAIWEDVDENTEMFFSDTRPVVFVEREGHGIGQIYRAMVSAPFVGRYTFGNSKFEFDGGDGIVLIPSADGNTSEIPTEANVAYEYSLISFAETIWPEKNNDSGWFFSSYDLLTTIRGVQIANMGEVFNSVDHNRGANPPWAWSELFDCDGACGGMCADCSSRGDWLLDPAQFVNSHIPDLSGFSLNYVRNPYLAGNNKLMMVTPNAWAVGELETVRWTVTEAGIGESGISEYGVLELIASDGSIPWTSIETVVDAELRTVIVPEVEPGVYRVQLRAESDIADGSFLPIIGLSEPFTISSPTSDSHTISVAYGANGQVEPSGEVTILNGGDALLTGIPDSGYEVEYWRLDYNVAQIGGNTFTIYDVVDNHDVLVTFRPQAEPGVITVTAPNGGEVWYCDDRVTIAWDSEGETGDLVAIDLFRTGTLYEPIAEETDNDGFYRWDIAESQALDDEYQVVVSSLAGSDWDMSDDYFTIAYQVVQDTISIFSADDLSVVSSEGANPSDAYYILMNDIDASSIENFSPIGPDIHSRFQGTFDGRGYTIRNLEINYPSCDEIGLFARLGENAIVRNLNIEVERIEGSDRVGALAGMNEGLIQNCHVAIIDDFNAGDTGAEIGGLVGLNTGEIRNSSVSCVGSASLYTDRTVAEVGGLVGTNQGLIEWCWTDMDLYAFVDEVGGLVGRNQGAIVECYTKGEWIRGRSETGGIVGNMAGGIVEDCHFSGNFTEVNEIGGGIVGNNVAGIVRRCYVNGRVQSGSDAGALIGRNNSTIEQSFWNVGVVDVAQPIGSGDGAVVDCQGVSDAEMRQEGTYTTTDNTDWDFDSIWAICEEVGYPVLRGIGETLATPDNQEASTDQADGIHLAWGPITFNTYDSSGLTCSAFYEVSRSDSPALDSNRTILSQWQRETAFVDTGTVENEIFYYWVRAAATNRGARASAYCNPAEGLRTVAPLDAPMSVYASEDIANYVFVEWSAVPGASCYLLCRADSLEGDRVEIGPWQASLSYIDIPPDVDVPYYYWVKAAANDSGDRESDFGGPAIGSYSDMAAVHIQHFQAAWCDGTAVLTWSNVDVSDNSLRLIGTSGSEQWNVSWQTDSDGQCVAYDNMGSDAHGSTVSYRIEVELGEDAWATLAMTTLDIPVLFSCLHGPFPNPFNPSTTLSFYIAYPGHIELEIYDVTGRKIRNLASAPMTAGAYAIVWNGLDDGGRSVPTGVYMARLTTPETSESKKLLLLR